LVWSTAQTNFQPESLYLRQSLFGSLQIKHGKIFRRK
jgi:hypothetical protein